MTVCQENINHTQELQKQTHNKGVKSKSYAPGDIIWLNNKYTKTKQNQKLKAKFFRSFWVLHLVGKQAYKLKLSKKCRSHNVFYMSLLEQDTTRKKQVEKIPESDADHNSKEYKVEAIWDSASYANKSESGHLSGLYYLVAWKGYPKEENIWEPLSVVQHFKKLISSFHKDYLEKPITTFPPIDSAPPISRSIIKPTQLITKQKQGRPANSVNKQAKKNLEQLVQQTTPILAGRNLPSFADFSLSYQTSVFFLSLPLGWEVFYWRPSIKWLPSSFDFPSLVSYWVTRFFYWQYLLIFPSAFLWG